MRSEQHESPVKLHLGTIGTESCDDGGDGTSKHTYGNVLDMCPSQRSLASPERIAASSGVSPARYLEPTAAALLIC